MKLKTFKYYECVILTRKRVTLEKLVNCYETPYDDATEQEEEGNISMIYGFSCLKILNGIEKEGDRR